MAREKERNGSEMRNASRRRSGSEMKERRSEKGTRQWLRSAVDWLAGWLAGVVRQFSFPDVAFRRRLRAVWLAGEAGQGGSDVATKPRREKGSTQAAGAVRRRG